MMNAAASSLTPEQRLAVRIGDAIGTGPHASHHGFVVLPRITLEQLDRIPDLEELLELRYGTPVEAIREIRQLLTERCYVLCSCGTGLRLPHVLSNGDDEP